MKRGEHGGALKEADCPCGESFDIEFPRCTHCPECGSLVEWNCDEYGEDRIPGEWYLTYEDYE